MTRLRGFALALAAVTCWGCGPSPTEAPPGASPAPAPPVAAPPGPATSAAGYAYVAWNTRRAPWTSDHVRRAMTSLLDRRAIAERLAGDAGAVAEGPVAPGDPRHDPSIVSPAYDPEGAAHALRGEGLVRAGSGPWNTRDGTPARVVLLCGRGDLAQRTATAVAESLVRGGFAVEAQALPDSDLDARLHAGDFDAVVLFRPPGQPLDLAAEFGADGVGNPTHFVDGPLETLLHAGEPAFAKSYRRIVDLQPRTFLFYLGAERR